VAVISSGPGLEAYFFLSDFGAFSGERIYVKRSRRNMVDQKLLEILACPACKGGLICDEEDQKLVCQKCRLKYPVRDDIPVMLVDQAERF
jgi:uncharacterized protein YbaR (Trm112 family)